MLQKKVNIKNIEKKKSRKEKDQEIRKVKQ